jgi:hypothetical protein
MAAWHVNGGVSINMKYRNMERRRGVAAKSAVISISLNVAS